MSTAPRRQREFLAREELILDAAREILLESGYTHLTMERIAERIEYSKGTVYNHFRSKDDIIAAIYARTMDLRIPRFRHAATFPGSPREKITAIGICEELFWAAHPVHVISAEIVRTSGVYAALSEARREELQAQEARCMEVTVELIEEAVACGDLTLAPGATPQGITLSLWGLYIGTSDLMRGGFPTEPFGIDDMSENLRRSAQFLLDGVGWHPLSTEHDYRETERRTIEELFPDEAHWLR